MSESGSDDDTLEEIDLTFIRTRGPNSDDPPPKKEDQLQQQHSPTMMVLRIVMMAALYYPLSIGLTFYQKWFIKQYKLPLMVVSGHYVTKWLLAVGIRWLFECIRRSRRVRLSLRDQLRLLAPIGVCASLDIGLSNWALEYVTVSLYTMAKSSSIVFIVIFSLLLRLERWRASLAAEAVLIAVGLFLFTYQSAQLDIEGLMLVELAAACTGVRWTVSQLVMQREEHAVRHPLDMVAHVQPWMMIPIIPLIYVFEGDEITWKRLFMLNGHHNPADVMLYIFIGGVLAFCMELSEYLLLVHTSGITLSIFGIIKEVMTLILAASINGDKFSSVNLVGLVLCLLGMAIHSLAAARRKHKKSSSTLPPDDLRKLLEDES